jgi:hypothetical protein
MFAAIMVGRRMRRSADARAGRGRALVHPRQVKRREGLASVRNALLLGVVLLASDAAARGLPLLVELDGCVEPATACTTSDRITLNEGERKLSFAVETLRVLSSSGPTSGKVLTEMKLRPLRVHGPDDAVHKLAPGAHVRMRAALRLRERYLMVQSVEPR